MSRNLPTPMPVGSPHVANPPTFDRWGLGPQSVNRQEKRDYSRRDLRCDLWLVDLQSQCVLRCKTDDISDAGLHAYAPVGFGLAVGQRYEARVASIGGARAKEKARSPHMGASLGYATVIRTEMQIGEEMSDRVGFAIRFDVPQLIPV